jgi:hypothetical protein
LGVRASVNGCNQAEDGDECDHGLPEHRGISLLEVLPAPFRAHHPMFGARIKSAGGLAHPLAKNRP